MSPIRNRSQTLNSVDEDLKKLSTNIIEIYSLIIHIKIFNKFLTRNFHILSRHLLHSQDICLNRYPWDFIIYRCTKLCAKTILNFIVQIRLKRESNSSLKIRAKFTLFRRNVSTISVVSRSEFSNITKREIISQKFNSKFDIEIFWTTKTSSLSKYVNNNFSEECNNLSNIQVSPRWLSWLRWQVLDLLVERPRGFDSRLGHAFYEK